MKMARVVAAVAGGADGDGGRERERERERVREGGKKMSIGLESEL
jgi:hypothetical protein